MYINKMWQIESKELSNYKMDFELKMAANLDEKQLKNFRPYLRIVLHLSYAFVSET